MQIMLGLWNALADGARGTTKLLYQVVQRSLAYGDEDALFLKEAIDPTYSVIPLPDTSPAFTQKYLASFRDDLPEDESKAVLQDRLDTGWLVWGKEMEVNRMPGWDEVTWEMDEACKPGVKIIEEAISGEGFWRSVSGCILRFV